MKGTMTHREYIWQFVEKLCNEVTVVRGWSATQLGLHLRTWSAPKSQFAFALQRMIEALADYADIHAHKYELPIGEDVVLGKEWANAVYAVRGLLNGELGGLDGGILDKMLVGMLQREGFEK